MGCIILGTIRKQPLQLYRNACSRLDIRTLHSVEDRLSRQSLIELALDHLGKSIMYLVLLQSKIC
jgi:hypothetical protein